MEQAGHGDRNEPNQDEITVSLFIKRLVLGEDSEYLNHNCKQKWRKGLGVPMTSSPLLSWLRTPSPQNSTRGEAGCQTPSWAHGEPGTLEDQVGAPQDQEQPHPRAQRGQLCAPQTGVMPRPRRGISEGVRPVSPGSGGQNQRTAPPLASGHLNERSAPGGTGSPRSIFGRGSRNPEDRVGRQRREEKTDKTQKERGKEAR